MSDLVCVGELLVDFIGEERKSLEENTEFSKRPGGAPANVAVAAARLGADVEMVATVGEDEFGEFLLEKLREEEVGTDRIEKLDQRTTLAFASLDEGAKPHFMFYREADEHISTEQLDLEPEGIVHLGSLPLTDEKTAGNVLEFAESIDAPVSFDPNLREDLMSAEYEERLKRLINHVDILTAAEEEIEFFGGLERLREKVGEIIITRGSSGAELVTPEDRFGEDAEDVKVVDTTGAGDALTGTYLAFRNRGKREALQKAVKAASISTTAKGAMSALPGRTELE